jgi:hypothetical protein
LEFCCGGVSDGAIRTIFLSARSAPAALAGRFDFSVRASSRAEFVRESGQGTGGHITEIDVGESAGARRGGGMAGEGERRLPERDVDGMVWTGELTEH